GATATTGLVMNQEQTQSGTRFSVQLSDGRQSQVNVLPNVASQQAMERLQLNSCSDDTNCQIELREVGSGSSAKAVYQVQAQKQTKVLGLFNAQMRVQAQIDAETGEVLSTSSPWWSFAARS
ncbi:MAG: hypothetical protein KC535_05795, partial [Nanoarchaeota archaeon]|nr:hypothetical protein [Nanoarchaeota archaeon]